jgi:hypothetical protein
VDPGPLVVRADDHARPYVSGQPGARLPPVTYSIDGFVHGDTVSVVTGTPVLSTIAAAASGIGSSPITVAQATLAAANYAFSQIARTQVVTASRTPGDTPVEQHLGRRT